MSRRYILRFDIWICLAVAFLVSLGTEALMKNMLTQKYEDHKTEHIVGVGEIGGVATEEVFRAESVKDLENHETFTVVSPGIEYRNRGGGYYGGIAVVQHLSYVSFHSQASFLPVTAAA